MKELEPIKKLSSMNKEKREALKQASKQLASFLKNAMPKLGSKDAAASISTHDFTAHFCILAEQLKRIAIELGSSEQIEFALLRDENFNNRIMR